MNDPAFQQAALVVAEQCHIWGDHSHQVEVITEMMKATFVSETELIADPANAANRIAAYLDDGFRNI